MESSRKWSLWSCFCAQSDVETKKVAGKDKNIHFSFFFPSPFFLPLPPSSLFPSSFPSFDTCNASKRAILQTPTTTRLKKGLLVGLFKTPTKCMACLLNSPYWSGHWELSSTIMVAGVTTI